MGCCESIQSDGNEYEHRDYTRHSSQEPIVQTVRVQRRRKQQPQQRNHNKRKKTPNGRRQSKTKTPERNQKGFTQKSTNDWNIHQRLAETEHIDSKSAKNIVELFENENTIPFICRYRQDMIHPNINPKKMRSIKNSYTNIIELRKQAINIIDELEKVIQVDDGIRTQILNAKTFKDLEYLKSVYKPSQINVKSLGIDTHAYRLLLGQSPEVQLIEIIDKANPNLNTIDKGKIGLSFVISELFSKHRSILDQLRQLQKRHNLILKCNEAKCENKEPTKTVDSAKKSKYETYFKFENDIRFVKPHQILAINRAEKMKYIEVNVLLPDNFKNAIRSYIYGQFMVSGIKYSLRNEIFDMAFEKCYNGNLVSLVSKQVRNDLTELGKKDAIECFAKNVKQLLLQPPLKGERVLGVDPGFKNGCKLAVVSETSDVLDVGIIYPNRNNTSEEDSFKWGVKLADLLVKHGCKTIALGDGQGCRETELWLDKLFEKGILDRKNIWYYIVSEQGTSVYSCSDLARKEFPKLDVKLISAVSIARRLIDPLSEYVKVEPQHLGVGMYQMDINKKLLAKSLNEVVSECVSFVGVDINTASLSVLRYVAGLNHEKAKSIINYRQNNGPFRTRHELLRVKTIGKSTFIQCAGFIRIDPKNVGGKLENVLDCTCVHPESYTVAIDIITRCKLEPKEFGSPKFISEINLFVNSNHVNELAKHFEIPVERLQIILNALQRPLLQNYRPEFDKKVFLKDVTKFDDLFVGQIVTGEVRNIVHFGAYVNIGLGNDALLHKTKMNKVELKLGDRVSTSVIDLDVDKKRIWLRLDEVL